MLREARRALKVCCYCLFCWGRGEAHRPALEHLDGHFDHGHGACAVRARGSGAGCGGRLLGLWTLALAQPQVAGDFEVDRKYGYHTSYTAVPQNRGVHTAFTRKTEID